MSQQAFGSQFSILNSQFIPASSLSIEALADLYTRMFGDYFYPASVTAAELAERIPSEQLLLEHSPLLCIGDTPAGLALLGVRGERACCGGFGIVPAQRGRSLALPLTLALIEQARQCGARSMALIVLAQNERAITTYQRAGFSIWREIRSFEWARGEDIPAPAARDAPTLGSLSGLEGLALIHESAIVAYLLLRRAPDGAADILSLGARSTADAAGALAALQRQSDRITCLNEPADSPGAQAMDALGFARTFRRYEMVVSL